MLSRVFSNHFSDLDKSSRRELSEFWVTDFRLLSEEDVFICLKPFWELPIFSYWEKVFWPLLEKLLLAVPFLLAKKEVLFN